MSARCQQYCVHVIPTDDATQTRSYSSNGDGTLVKQTANSVTTRYAQAAEGGTAAWSRQHSRNWSEAGKALRKSGIAEITDRDGEAKKT